MYIKQLNVFIENRHGKLEEVYSILAKNDINVISTTIADVSEYGLIRMVVSDPHAAKEVLSDEGYSASLTDVLAVKLPNKVGSLQTLIQVLTFGGVTISYLYTMATGESSASMVVKVSESDRALEALEENGFEVFSAEEAYAITA
ncbi:MAG: amino acid-binding protein [Lachnospiraceae bacterium]|nr:amino acid-binding protein [Lachnospiraceae bacterium]